MDNPRLWPRESEVLALLAQGYSDQEIADRLTVTIQTIKGHTTRIYGKIGVSEAPRGARRVRAALWWWRGVGIERATAG